MRRGLLLPFTLGAVLLIAVPAVVTVGLAFTSYDGLGAPEWVGLGNVSRLLRDPLLGGVLFSTFVYLIVAVPLRVGGALGLALLLHRPAPGVGLARTVAYLPTIVPAVAYGLVWLWILNPLFGPVNTGLDSLGLPTPAWLTEPNQARIGLGIMSAFQLGEGFVVTLAARQEVPGALYDVARVEGGSVWARFRHVTLPVLAPLLFLLAARDTVVALSGSFVAALVVTGGGPEHATRFLPLHVFRTGFGAFRFGYAAMLSVLTFAITAAIVWAQARVVRPTRILLD